MGPALICAHFLQHLCRYNSAHFMHGDVDMERSVTFLQSPAAVAGLWISCHGWNHFLCKEALVCCVHVSFQSVSSWWLADSPLLTMGCRALSCVSQRSGQETTGAQTHGAWDRGASVLPIASPPQAPNKPPLPKTVPGSTDEHKACQWVSHCPRRRAWGGGGGGDWNALVPSFARPLSGAAPLRVSARDGKAWTLDFCPENKCLPAESPPVSPACRPGAVPGGPQAGAEPGPLSHHRAVTWAWASSVAST